MYLTVRRADQASKLVLASASASASVTNSSGLYISRSLMYILVSSLGSRNHHPWHGAWYWYGKPGSCLVPSTDSSSGSSSPRIPTSPS